jgi:hypothetical protein
MQYWYLTKGSLGKHGTELRAFSKPPKSGSYLITDYDRINSKFIIMDSNGNNLGYYPVDDLENNRRKDHAYDKVLNPGLLSRDDPFVRDILHRELNKIRFKEGYPEVNREPEIPYRMIEDYVDRKKKSTSAKPKRKPAKKPAKKVVRKTKSCGCK